MSGADVYRLPAQRDPKPAPRDFGFLTIVSIIQEGKDYKVLFSGKDKEPALHAMVPLDLASTLRVGMCVRLVLEEDLV